jgi:lipopolysaccharide transport system ATP-binding protein
MSSDVIIQVTNLGKRYRIAHQRQRQRYVALRDVIAEKAKGFFRGRKPVAGSNAGPTSEDFWALKDLSFEVKRGEVIGIIGRNGAGKSTLLKILSRITEPTEGRVTLRGRVASLLEVGTGFHPELTGRENIFLNGAILGMHRAEIKQKFDEIVAFAEVEKFLDTPVKRYSSGMYVRLAFAVAAHLEPEILIVDEVLAVGDAEFQKKCLGKMGQVANAGRTVLFVSHNMTAIRALCPKGILLNAGRIQFVGSSAEAARVYLESHDKSRCLERPPRKDGFPTVTRLEMESVEAREETIIKLRFEVMSRIPMRACFEVLLLDGAKAPLGIASVGLVDPANLIEFQPGREMIACSLRLPRMARGLYRLSVQLTVPLVKIIDSTGDGVAFEINPDPIEGRARAIDLNWGAGALEIPIEFLRGEVRHLEVS